ncbi:VOC family protein [Actinomadura sp. B10D3]|uniref:VOC family protein n=1 Tax=Actinomadura sp. B10D3 TaxID=3153557 RepID=UPI00325F35BD
MINGAHVILYSNDAEACDDVRATLDELTGKGVKVAAPISDQGWGLLAAIELPSGAELPIYQPRHPLAKDL